MTKAIYFDMDGTIANLYGVENWLEKIMNEDASLYIEALPLLKLNVLARLLNNLQKKGWVIGIVSWLAKNSSENYDIEVAKAKTNWLNSHLASVKFDEINIVPYGTPKKEVVNFPNGILFDDEIQNRENWIGKAFNETEILEVLKAL